MSLGGKGGLIDGSQHCCWMFCLITGDFVHYFYFSLKSGDWSHIQEVEIAGTNRVTATAPLQPPTALLVIMAKQ